jgi:hypothetical protein
LLWGGAPEDGDMSAMPWAKAAMARATGFDEWWQRASKADIVWIGSLLTKVRSAMGCFSVNGYSNAV